jgi:hypothetical protein
VIPDGDRDFDAFNRVARARRSVRAFVTRIHLTSFANVRATVPERLRALPGDTLLPDASTIVMHAVTIVAPVERVWPWLVQMGAGRAGWYSHDWVDNGGTPSAVTIVPELQHLAPGDVLPSLPGAKDSFIAAVVEAERDLVLTVPAAGGGLLVSWEFFLEPRARRTTRLLVRGRVSSQWPSGGPGKTSVSPRLIERAYALLASAPRWLMAPAAKFGHGVMQARQLRGIKQRAEAAGGSEGVSQRSHTATGLPPKAPNDLPSTQRVLLLRKFGGPDGFVVVERPMPVPASGEVLARAKPMTRSQLEIRRTTC